MGFVPSPPGLIRRKAASPHGEAGGFSSRAQLRLKPSDSKLQGRTITLDAGYHHLIPMNDLLKRRPFISFAVCGVSSKMLLLSHFCSQGPR